MEKIDVSRYPRDDKDRPVIPDEIVRERYRDLPDGCIDESGEHITYNGGLLTTLTPEIRRKGYAAMMEQKQKRKTFAETIDLALSRRASAEALQSAGMESGTVLDVIVQSIIAATRDGNVKAAEFLRDSVGEKPVSREEITADIISAEQKALIDKVAKRVAEARQTVADDTNIV
jgi:hypothetical protein